MDLIEYAVIFGLFLANVVTMLSLYVVARRFGDFRGNVIASFKHYRRLIEGTQFDEANEAELPIPPPPPNYRPEKPKAIFRRKEPKKKEEKPTEEKPELFF